MTDASTSRVPPDQVEEPSQRNTAEEERRQADELARTNPAEQPGIPDEPKGPADGGD